MERIFKKSDYNIEKVNFGSKFLLLNENFNRYRLEISNNIS
jgi:hypothetical protein